MITRAMFVTVCALMPQCATLDELVTEHFEPDDRELMLEVAWCESSAKPEDQWSTSINKKSGASGWFQHLPKWWDERSTKAGYEGAHILDPNANVAVASWLYYNMDSNERWGGASHWYPSRRCWGGK